MSELQHLLTDWPHWAFEAVTDAVFAGGAFLLGRLSTRRRRERRIMALDPLTNPWRVN